MELTFNGNSCTLPLELRNAWEFMITTCAEHEMYLDDKGKNNSSVYTRKMKIINVMSFWCTGMHKNVKTYLGKYSHIPSTSRSARKVARGLFDYKYDQVQPIILRNYARRIMLFGYFGDNPQCMLKILPLELFVIIYDMVK